MFEYMIFHFTTFFIIFSHRLMNFMNFMNWSQVMEVKSNLVKEDRRCYFHIEFRSLQR